MNFLVYIILRFVVFFVNLLPHDTALSLGSFVGSFVFALGGSRKRMILDNIVRAFGGEKTRADAEFIASSLYKNVGMSFMEFARLGLGGAEYLERSVTFEGLSNIDKALESKKGVVLLSAHFGNWELLNLAVINRGYNVSVVARPLDNPYIDNYIKGLRTAGDNEVIDKKNAVRKMIGLLRANRILGILLDQRASRRDGVVVDFFGIPALTSKALAAIVAKTGSTVMPVFIRRAGRDRESRGRHVVMCGDPLEIVSTGDKEADVLENTRRFALAIEKYIRLYPDEWFWFHSRWERRKKRGRIEQHGK